MRKADIVVIGAGINGAAIAYHLARRGLDVALIEKHLIAAGGTGRSAAIVRQHYSNAELVRLVKRSVEIFQNFDTEIGGDPGFVASGWAFLIPASVSEGFTRNLAMGQRLGVDVREISPADLNDIEPRVNLEGVHRCAYEPNSGYADPRATTHAYVARFVDIGGSLETLTSLVGIDIEAGAVKGVRTNRGNIASEIIVNAAGPWAGQVSKMAGIDMPLEIIFATTDAPPKLCFSDMALAIYYRPHGPDRMLLGRGFPKEYLYVEPDGYNQEVETHFIADTTERLKQRWPSWAGIIAIDSYTGLYDVTPDWHPILGRVDGLDGFYMCAGFSGHGFKIGPAIGEVMAEEIVDGGARSIDISRLTLSRFARGELIGAAYGTNRA